VCGILGCVGLQPQYSPSEIDSIISKIAHRGPDESGFLQTSELFLANTRLSIRGGDHGKQPLFSRSKNSVLIYNGEIYNSSELALKYGLELSSTEIYSDSKFLVEFLEMFEETKVSELDGAFAFVWVNLLTLNTIGARDRYGQKPLYYCDNDGSLFFASEIAPIKAMLSEKEFSINTESVMEYLIFQNLLTKNTFFNGIKHIMPGQFFKYNIHSRQLVLKKYWNPKYAQKENSYLGDALETGIFSQIRDQSILSTLLSSGVDSSILALTIKKYGINQYNITADYSDEPDHEFNETKMVTDFATVENLTLIKVRIGSINFYENIMKVIDFLEEPRVGQSVLNYLVFTEAAQYSKVSISGAGADELFGGYPWRYPLEVIGAEILPRNVNAIDFISSKQFKVLPVEMISRLLDRPIIEIQEFQRSRISDVLKEIEIDKSDQWANVYNALAFDLLTFLPGLLQVDDRLSMKNSLEVRTPFLANRIVDFALGLHPKEFFAMGNSGIIGKMPLRNYLGNLGHLEVANRKKIGFSSPDAKWFAEHIITLAQIFDDKKFLSKSPKLNQEILNKLLDEHILKGNLRGWCWSYLNLMRVLSN